MTKSKNKITIQNQRVLGSLIDSDFTYHILGIGGIGMSAIAKVLIAHNFKVSGSDIAENANIKTLREVGVECTIGHFASNIKSDQIIVHSAAIKEDNIELKTARENGNFILSRSEIMNNILDSTNNVCISGMHGKTTTSSMQALIFEYAGVKHLSMIGGIMRHNNSNCIVHKNFTWGVIEADESDDTFIKLPRTISVITNLSPEHLDYHLTFENLRTKFIQYITDIPQYGFSVVCVDDERVLELAKHVDQKSLITYSVETIKAKYYAANIHLANPFHMEFDVYNSDHFVKRFELNIPGIFNISNAMATIAVSLELEIDPEIAYKALKDFRSSRRRFDILGQYQNATVVDDYAHHPREINATVESALDYAKYMNAKLIIVMQPHRFSRVQKLLREFCDCDIYKANSVIILPIYGAGEKPIHNIDSRIIAEYTQKRNQNTIYCGSFDSAKEVLKQKTLEKSIVLCMGAGDISGFAQKLVIENEKPSPDLK